MSVCGILLNTFYDIYIFDDTERAREQSETMEGEEVVAQQIAEILFGHNYNTTTTTTGGGATTTGMTWNA